VFQIESIKAKEFALPVVQISREIFCLLQHADGESSMTEVLRQSGLNDTAIQDRLLEEISDLWGRRLIILAPQNRRQSQLSQEEQEAEYVDN
jgi:hypothetical protein